MQKGLVSILTPCFNGEKLIHRLLDSILEQDYPMIEMYVIDDGSTDNSKDVICGYISKFENKGYTLDYVYQENAGQSVAINNGLKLINGEYLIWPDCDDWYNNSNAISKFVNALQVLSDEFAEVRCMPTYVNEDDLSLAGQINISENTFNPQQFLSCLYSEDFVWGAGNYMLRTSALDKVNPQREIFTKKDAGQNWQIHMPVLFSYKVYTLEESLINVLVRRSSHSRGLYSTYQQQIGRIDAYEMTVLETLKRIDLMSGEDREKYSREVKKRYNMQKMFLALSNNNAKDAAKYRSLLNSSDVDKVGRFDRIVFQMAKYPLFSVATYRIGLLIKRIVGKLARIRRS